jgi:hypothetical protein
LLPFASMKINRIGEVKILDFDRFGHLKSWWGTHHASHTCTLRMAIRTLTGVHTSYGSGNSVKPLVANDKYLLICNFRTYYKVLKFKSANWEQ